MLRRYEGNSVLLWTILDIDIPLISIHLLCCSLTPRSTSIQERRRKMKKVAIGAADLDQWKWRETADQKK